MTASIVTAFSLLGRTDSELDEASTSRLEVGALLFRLLACDGLTSYTSLGDWSRWLSGEALA